MKNKELDLVEKIRTLARKAADKQRQPPGFTLRLGIGDDAAVLGPSTGNQEVLITTDLLVEGAHFDPARHPANAVGHKALARGLSDIAAMGARPRYALLSLCLPPWAAKSWKKQFLAGLFRLARRYRVALIGGDVSAGATFVSDIIVLGTAARGRTLERRQAKVRQNLYVSGRLGGSAVGLQRLTAGTGARDAAVRRHLYPAPRVELGEYLASKLGIRAAMDLSDGLSIDLYRLAAESGVGAEIEADRVPLFPGATLDQALHGGEDYELLFAADPRQKIPAAFRRIPLTRIGVITRGRGLAIVQPNGRKRALHIEGFQHQL